MQEKVEVSHDEPSRHELILHYDYTAGSIDPTVPPVADHAYRDYVRFYLPELSSGIALYEVRDGDRGRREGVIEDMSIEHGKKVIGTFFRITPGESLELHLLFQAPLRDGRDYRLYLQKQAGIPTRPSTC